jgi:5'-nucleotidase/UDP-sugar diphosphatase
VARRSRLLSVLAADTVETSSPGPSVLILDEIDYLKDAVAEIEEEGIDKIMLLSHVGLPMDQQIAAQVDGIDVIVGGHSHTLLSNTQERRCRPIPDNGEQPLGRRRTDRPGLCLFEIPRRSEGYLR